jgi:hypothetical protein
MTFEIKNYNYYDLTKETCPQTKEEEAIPKPSTPKVKAKVGHFGHPGLHKTIEEIANHADDLASSIANSEELPPPPWMGKGAARQKPPPATETIADEDEARPKPPPATETIADEDEAETIANEVDADAGAESNDNTSEDEEAAEDEEARSRMEKKGEHEKGPSLWESPIVGHPGASLLSVDKGVCVVPHSSLAAIHAKSDTCKTVMDVLRSAMTDVVREVIKCVAATPHSSAPAPSPQAFLQSVQPAAPAAGAPAGAPAAPAAGAAVHVAFSPGTEVGSGRSVMVEITFTDTPGNGLDDLAMTKGLIERALKNGLLRKELKTSLALVAGIWPKLGKIKVKEASVEGWDVKKCEGHMRKIVQLLSHGYTREQVPMVMFNECTNFMTRISFSNDHVLDPMDTLMCRKTTATFAKHWNFGQKAAALAPAPAAAPGAVPSKDFEFMCMRSCEAKFGKNAPQCHVTAGDELLNKPLL